MISQNLIKESVIPWLTNSQLQLQSMYKIVYIHVIIWLFATCRWSHSHEKEAWDQFSARMSSVHRDFKIGDTGFFIDSERLYIGAYPDGIIQCS